MKNQNSTTIEQCLIELEKVGSPEVYKLIEQLSNLLDSGTIRQAEEQLKAHKYPDRTIKFVQVGNLNQCPQLIELSKTNPKAYHILMLIAGIVGKGNIISFQLYTSKSHPDGTSIQELTGYKRETIRDAMDMLIQCGFVGIIKKPSPRKAGIYCVNPLVAKTGNSSEAEFWSFAGPNSRETFDAMGQELELQIGSETVATESGKNLQVRKFIKPV